ncbi:MULTISPECIES: alkaline phosphatase family protein [Acidianus]|uniref:Nucleotide pyrophosphatase n=1 Tax=Candidatus Acidianus copahuensis TaxID=1160895 RepID=A0A031LR19_9CREN|nr:MULTISPECIES: alkaline phosphatase family protein [Acidianus]EZQ10832.1 nucleotide pyrophosphatase [Candidatus Acidianus copahuensis]NON61221.1 alkaline phosphatase family protein [Acidianus sp. RZ1]
MFIEEPNYGRNIYSLACGIAEFLGVERKCASRIEIPKTKKLALVLLDGFGWNIMESSGSTKEEAEKIQTVFPSTTSTVITTLFTALTPGEHGVLGYNTFVKKAGGIINTLKFTHPAVSDRDSLQDSMSFSSVFPGVKSYLSEVNGVKSMEIIPRGLENTEFSKATHGKTTETKTFVDLWDALYLFSQALNSDYNFIYLYLSDIDSLAHKYGPYAEPTLNAAKVIFESIYNTAKRFSNQATTVITADHGHVEVGSNVDIKSDQQFMSMVEVPPYGDSRALFLRSRYDMKTYMLDKYNVKVYTKEELPRLLGGVGYADLPDFVAVPKDNTAYIYDYKEGGDYGKLKGHHGGLLSEEFEIPLVII